MNFNIIRFDTIDSTNSEAARQAKLGADEGLCIIAREQTAGRGRYGRTWVSGKDAGLYFSIVLRPKIDLKFLPLITLMTGVAVHDLLASYRLHPDIKWVNDILVGESKICGILAESLDTSCGLAVILGVGINVSAQHFPKDIVSLVTSMEAELPETETVTVSGLEGNLVHFIGFWYDILKGKDGHSKVLQHWQWRSSYFSGKGVRVTLENEIFEGITEGLEENGALRVKTEDGSVRIVQAGDVERLRHV